MHHIITPSSFNRWYKPLTLLGGLLSVPLFLFGIYYALFASPPDGLQGESVRIMYVHVPSAWLSLAIYSAMASLSVGFLVWNNPMTDIIARSLAPIGAVFTLNTLLTGAIWGKPTWGAWWVWDARLTTELILFLFYVGYILLSHAFENPERTAKSCALLAVVGFVNIPLVKFSVDFWNTLHQPASLLKADGPAIHSSMLLPLMLMFGAFSALTLLLAVMNTKRELTHKKINRVL